MARRLPARIQQLSGVSSSGYAPEEYMRYSPIGSAVEIATKRRPAILGIHVMVKRFLSMPMLPSAGGASCWLAALAGVVLMAVAIQGLADSRERLGAGDTIRVTVFQNPDLTT